MNKTFIATTSALALAGASALLATPSLADPGSLAEAGGPSNKVKFGSVLNPTIQPSNSLPGLYCDQMNPATTCSFVMNEAYGRPDGGEKSPAKGTLKKVKVIAGGAGSFQLQLVKAKEVAGVWQAKVKAQGPVITVEGQDQANLDSDSYKVEAFKVNMPIKKGWRLSMKSSSTSAVRCSSGGDNTLIFAPPLQSGAGFEQASGDDGCWPLIEGVVKRS